MISDIAELTEGYFAASYGSLNEAKEALEKHAADNRYALKKTQGKNEKGGLGYCRHSFECFFSGHHSGCPGNSMRSTKKCGCGFKVAISKRSKSPDWKVTILEGKHNHSAAKSFDIFHKKRKEILMVNEKVVDEGIEH